MNTHSFPIRRALLGAVTVLLAVAVATPARAQTTLCLYAGETVFDPTPGLPLSGDEIPMWGFAEEPDCNFTTLEGGPVTVPGPRLTVPVGETQVTIDLHNTLSVPVSLTIPGQIPASTSVVRFPPGDPDYPDRIRSFAAEVPAGGTGSYTWNQWRHGSFVYKSATQQQVQVQMGLYGAITQDFAAGQAYGDPLTSSYDNEVILFYSEIDPALHDAVDTGAYGRSGPVTSTISYLPKYFLINGAPYPDAAPVVDGGPDGTLAVGETTLIRFFNTGLQTIIPTLLGWHLDIVAEDGNEYPYPFTQYTVTMVAGKTHDAVFAPTQGGEYPIIDRALNLTNAADGPGGMQVMLQVAAPAGYPVAIADSYAVNEEATLIVDGLPPNPVVVANDNNGGAPGIDSPMAPTLVQAPQHHNGVFTLNPDGSFTYQPVTDFFGADFFLYTANDGIYESQPVEVVITVNNINDLPTAVADAYSTPEDVVLSVEAPGVVGNDIDVDNDPLYTSLITAPTSGTLDLALNGSFVYTPDANYFGADSFSYEVFDDAARTQSGGVVAVDITVTSVNDVPVGVPETVAPVYQNRLFILPAPGVLANDTDVDVGDTLTAVLDRGPRHGALTLNADGSFTYLSDPAYAGADDFLYRANDGTANSLMTRVSFVVQALDMIFADNFETSNVAAWSASSGGVAP